VQYLLLIYENEGDWQRRSDAERAARTGEYMAFAEGIVKSGQYKAGARLALSPDATTVRVQGGRTLTTDGPYAETKEQLGGYFLVEAKDLDEAIAIAARLPGAAAGAVEVRPLWHCGTGTG
jgi:hypothetical protein